MAVVLGIGCDRGASQETLAATVAQCLLQAGLDCGAVCALATIDKKCTVLCVQPDGIWYYYVTEVNLDRIIRDHLVGGRPVEDLIYHRGPDHAAG